MPQIGEEERRRRILLARLEDERVPARDRVGEHPHRHHCGEVERRDPRHDAERLPDREHIDSARRLLGEASLEQVGNAACELDVLDAPRHLAPGVGDDLPVLRRDERSEVVAVLVEQIAECEEHGRALRQRSRPPLPKGSRSGLDGAGLAAGGRVEDGTLFARGPFDYLATDPVTDPLQAAIVAFCRVRAVSTSARWRLYSAVARTSPVGSMSDPLWAAASAAEAPPASARSTAAPRRGVLARFA